MYPLLVPRKITLWRNLVVTFPAWVRFSFMYSLLVLSSLVVTFPAWVLLSFMYRSLLLSKTTLQSCLVVTFCACTAHLCWVRPPSGVAWCSHSLQAYFFSSCITTWWLLRPPLLFVHWQNLWQDYSISWCKLLWCIFSIHFASALYCRWAQANIFALLQQ